MIAGRRGVTGRRADFEATMAVQLHSWCTPPKQSVWKVLLSNKHGVTENTIMNLPGFSGDSFS